MSVSADVDSVRKEQASRLACHVEEAEERDAEDEDEVSPKENECGSNDAGKSDHEGQNMSEALPNEEDAAPKRPMTRRRRASVAVSQQPVEVAEGPRTRGRREESVALDAEAPDPKGTQLEQVALETAGRTTRARVRRGAAPVQQPSGATSVQPAQHVSTGEIPTASDTKRNRRGATKRGWAALAADTATAPDPAATDGNVSDSEGPVTRRRRAKGGAVPAASEEVTEVSGEVWGAKKKRGKRGNQAAPGGVIPT